jgi:hypothetical protein
MKTGKVAKALGIDLKTVTNWIQRNELKDFFSPGAKLESGKTQRDFDFNDQVLLNTIRYFRGEQGEKDWEKIASEIRSGYRQTEMPDSFYTTETTTSMQVYIQMLDVKNRLEIISSERDQLRDALEAERARFDTALEKERTRLQNESDRDRIRLQGELDKERIDRREKESDLNREIGRLLGQLDFLQQKDDED